MWKFVTDGEGDKENVAKSKDVAKSETVLNVKIASAVSETRSDSERVADTAVLAESSDTDGMQKKRSSDTLGSTGEINAAVFKGESVDSCLHTSLTACCR